MSSRIEQLIDEIETYIDHCKYQPLSNTKIIVNKDEIDELLRELRSKTPDEIKESVALNTDLKMWASAEAWDLEDDSPVEISEVKYDFDPEEIAEGDFDITFATKGRIFKIHTTDFQEEGKKVDLKFAPEDIHVMSKMGV